MASIYVVGEYVDRGPVKIGMTERPSSKGRAGLTGGNYRGLHLLGELEVPLSDLRWAEWRIHTALAPWHKRGEWFAVRPLLADWGDRWPRLLRAARAGRIAGGGEVKVGVRGHNLESIERIGTTRPLNFRARCSCGKVIRGVEGQAFLTVLRRFCVEHAVAEVPAGVGSNAPTKPKRS
jgi:hypothetical protein